MAGRPVTDRRQPPPQIFNFCEGPLLLMPRFESGWSTPPEPVEVASDVPRENLLIYQRLYQLERWLREMVYLELFAAFGYDWETEYARRMGQQKPGSKNPKKERDKALTHMRTKEERILAYADLSNLFTVIYDKQTATIDGLFAPYFPPGSVFGGKLEEILFIRHRVMHCRTVHASDHDRVIQFLKDIDQGFWSWCTSYNGSRISNSADHNDPVGARFLELDPMRSNVVDDSEPVAVQIEYSARPTARGVHDWWRQAPGEQSWLYHVSFYGNPGSERQIDSKMFLRNTRGLHSRSIYIHVGETRIEIALPRVADAADILKLVETLYDAARHCSFRSGREPLAASEYERLTRAYPEQILGPENPLSFLCPDMPCSWFGLDVELLP